MRRFNADHAISLPLLLNTATHVGIYVIVVFILSGLKQALLAQQRQRNRLEELGAARGVTVRLEDVGPLPPLPFDRDRMEQVLSNMVGNVLKFSPAGATVTVRVARENECKRIFVPFQRGSAQPVRGEKGTGLGPAISRKIVEAHGGQIGVESTVGRGSTTTSSRWRSRTRRSLTSSTGGCTPTAAKPPARCGAGTSPAHSRPPGAQRGRPSRNCTSSPAARGRSPVPR